MQKFYTLNLFIALILVSTSCAFFSKITGGKIGSSVDRSSKTGWKYNDPEEGGFYVNKAVEQSTGPGLVFIEGGLFRMGEIFEDVMNDWNTAPRNITINSFYMDETEIANIDWKEYVSWLTIVFGTEEFSNVILEALPDTLVWREELAYNEPWVLYYYNHPAYNEFPVVGVSWKQAKDYCIWRTDRVNELILIRLGMLDKEASNVEAITGLGGVESFNTESYLTGAFIGTPGDLAYDPKSPFKMPNGEPKDRIGKTDGVLLPEYRLPTEAEWEYAAYGLKAENYDPSSSPKKRGEELIASKHLYSWSNNKLGLRYKDATNADLVGAFQANFKRGRGDYMGIAGGLNDFACPTAGVRTSFPNAFGLYNMTGNVSEWVLDVYRPLSFTDGNDLNSFRGNVFTEYDLAEGAIGRDEKGRIKTTVAKDNLTSKRRNYQKNYLINYLDGDSITFTNYAYGQTTLISDKSRVIKGGSWADMPYYLVPSTRRFLEEDLSSNTIGFRCAMIRLGGQRLNDPTSAGYQFTSNRIASSR